MNRIKGFTLMELLVTIGIIGILSAISMFAIADSRKTARDGRRKADLESIRSALEFYRADCGRYAPSVTAGSTLQSGGAPCTASGIVYLQRVPGDPATGGNYNYRFISNVRYSICTHLENPPTTTMSGLSECGSGGCSGGGCNYIVTNP